jgi:hypothetical protein
VGCFLEGQSLVPSDLLMRSSTKSFGQKTVGLKGSEIDIRRCTKEDLDAIDERLRAWKAEQNVFYVALPYNDVLEAPH